jgi:hypothetical protein
MNGNQPSSLRAPCLEQNHSWRFVDECTLKEITSRVNQCKWRRTNCAPGDQATCELRKRCYQYTAKRQQAHLAEERQVYMGESWHAQPAIGGDKCAEHRVDVKCPYKSTDLEDDRCDCKSTGVITRTSTKYDQYQTTAFGLPRQFGTRLQMIFQRTEWFTIRHRKRPLPNGIMRDS